MTTLGGPLLPVSTPAPLEGQALLDFFQGWFVGLTGLPGNMIRPRWQPEPANLPSIATDWMAFGITNRDSDVFATELHFPSGSGYNELRRHEVLTISVSFYGPNADNFSHLLRDGMQISQNREILSIGNMGLVETGSVIPMPELIKDKWYYRLDMNIKVRRQIVRQYNVQSLLSASVALSNDLYVTPISVQGV